jgi:hypothetical protein
MIKTRGRYRDWYEHRMVVNEATEEFCFYGPGIPNGFEVHHIDYNRQHNKRHNLLMLDERIHHAIQAVNCKSQEPWMKRRSCYSKPATSEVPDWVTEEYDGKWDDEVA